MFATNARSCGNLKRSARRIEIEKRHEKMAWWFNWFSCHPIVFTANPALRGSFAGLREPKQQDDPG
eukprot:9191137-Pyramimonas_sp.AAC.1